MFGNHAYHSIAAIYNSIAKEIVQKQIYSHDIRELTINPDHWYVVAQSTDVQAQAFGVEIWYQSIVIYRDMQGYALGICTIF